MEHEITVDGHAHGLWIAWVTPGSNKSEIFNVVIGTQSGHAADVEWPRRLDQYNRQCQESVLR